MKLVNKCSIKEASVEETIAIINQIIDEHKVILRHTHDLEQVANDAEAMMTLDKSKEVFMPGRLDQGYGLQKFQELWVMVEEGLKAHFNKEETQLLAAFQKDGDEKLVTTLQTLLLEHKDISDRFNQEKKFIATLTTGQISRNIWQATAHDLRAHITHTRKLLEAHAEIEQELLHTMRKKITEAQEGIH
jgi:iron-sulfur cluster repair protein YtfE (RIC family)